MTQEAILAVVAKYRKMFEDRGIPKKMMDPKHYLGSLTSHERLAHAHHLLDGIVEFAQDPTKQGKTGRHLASVQVILSFEGWFTLEELMNHNRPESEKPSSLGLWSECHCTCHSLGGETRADHCVPCCAQCPWCALNISGDMNAHISAEHPHCVGHVPSQGMVNVLNLIE